MEPVRIFVGSSSKARRIMTALCADLRHPRFRVTPWTASAAFGAGSTIIGSLLRAFENHDFGIFIVSPVYTVKSDQGELLMPADNVILEVGMSIMKYGLEKTIMIVHRDTQMPSDLGGVLTLRYSGEIEDVNDWMPGFVPQVENAILNHLEK